MTDFLQLLSGGDAFMPHGMCYLWEPGLLWTHVVADTLTWLAYWAIPPALIYLVFRARLEVPEGASYAERAVPYDWMFWAFGFFIVACGGTHLMNVWTVWNPHYWASAGVKAVTATASVATAIALPPLIPRVLEVIRDARTSDVRRQKLEEANAELERLNREIQESERRKTEFFANVSHELRTPLTLVLGPLERLIEEEPGAERRERLETARRNARTLLGHVEDLLDVAKLEEGALPLDLAEADLSPLVGDVVDAFRPAAAQRSVDLAAEIPSSVPGVVDPRKVRRIVQNLLSNALRFAPEGSAVRCVLRSVEDPGEGDAGRVAELTVADAGPGVPPQDRERIFERFGRASGLRGAHAEGTGLGLAIVREFAEAMGGSVGVGDAPEGGALFTVRIPLGAPGQAAPEDAVGEPAAAASVPVWPMEAAPGRPAPKGPLADPEAPEATLLVVDDNPDLCDHLADVLGDRYRVFAAHDGREGLARARDLRPDLIVTDVMMPAMGGEELLASLQADPELGQIPVIVLTARADEVLPARLLEGGARDYLVKPMESGELRARVANVLDLTRTRRILESETGVQGSRLEELARRVGHAKAELTRALEQRDLLLQELHHRVKGNLQTVSSLLALQRRRVESESAAAVLDDARGRISAMAMVHEQLYAGAEPGDLAMEEYLPRLVEHTVRSRGREGVRITTDVRCDEVRMHIDQAIPVALIVHELTTNALEHAFVGSGEGRLGVTLTAPRKAAEAVLRVTDDGAGLDPDSRPGLGLELVEDLVRQLGGKIRRSTEAGTTVTIEIPLEGDPP